MGSKESRSRSSISRKQGNRHVYPRILIVCEGAETEPLYFNELRQKLRLPSIDCKIVPSDWGTSPDKVVGYAEHLVRNQGWEEAWCVFDRDEHHNFEQAVRRASELDGLIAKRGMAPTIFRAIPSDPCFELWYLIHFESLTREEHRSQVRRYLSRHIPDYEKSLPGVWALLEPKLQKAMQHAATLRQRKTDTRNPNPSTDVDLLVKRLMEIRQ